MKITFNKRLTLTDIDVDSRLISYKEEEFLNIENSLITHKYVPVKGDKLWFYPGCNIPRFKLKQFCQKHKVSLVKYADKATVKFIGPDNIKEMVESSYYYLLPSNEFIMWLDTVMCNAYEPLKQIILQSPDLDVLVTNEFLYTINDENDMFEDKYYTGKSNCTEIQISRNEKSYQHLLAISNDTNLYHQDDILSFLNTGVQMDEKMYHDIHRLFESSDKENTKLAMEAMANCDFQKSAVYLLLLIKEFGDSIYSSGNRNHVNFKSLLKYFQLTDITRLSIDDLINALRHQKLLNVENLNELMPLAMEVIRENGDMENIKIKDVELSSEAEKSVAENILDQQVILPPPNTEIMFKQTPEPDLSSLT